MEADHTAARARFERIFDSYYAELTRFATRRVGPDTAGDVVASTFLIAWRRVAEIPTQHPRAWLYATARHVIANELRAQARRDRLGARVGPADAASVEDHAGQVSEQLRVGAVLAELSPADQEVLRLTEWEGLDLAEVALVLGCSRTTAKVRLHRARRRFAAKLFATDGADDRPYPIPPPPIVAEGSTQS